ncbi:MAG: hypothetical protein PHF89_04870 [Eubacteriales bacterium]|nr:hypothetical protein [Eubacteriales bacterium]
MRISGVTVYTGNQQKQNNSTTFAANLNQIVQKLPTAKICPCKAQMLGSVVAFFQEVQTQLAKIADAPKEFIYKLGENNKVPKSMRQVQVNGLTIEAFDKLLTSSTFKCASGDCLSKTNKGKFIAELLEKIGVESPKTISISK